MKLSGPGCRNHDTFEISIVNNKHDFLRPLGRLVAFPGFIASLQIVISVGGEESDSQQYENMVYMCFYFQPSAGRRDRRQHYGGMWEGSAPHSPVSHYTTGHVRCRVVEYRQVKAIVHNSENILHAGQ